MAGHAPGGFGEVVQNKGQKSKRKRQDLWIWGLALSPQTLILIVALGFYVIVSLLRKW